MMAKFMRVISKLIALIRSIGHSEPKDIIGHTFRRSSICSCCGIDFWPRIKFNGVRFIFVKKHGHWPIVRGCTFKEENDDA